MAFDPSLMGNIRLSGMRILQYVHTNMQRHAGTQPREVASHARHENTQLVGEPAESIDLNGWDLQSSANIRPRRKIRRVLARKKIVDFMGKR
jgi:hypothetical protein